MVRILLLLWIQLLFWGVNCQATPLITGDETFIKSFSDDFDRESLLQATERSLDYLHARPAHSTFTSTGVSVRRLSESLSFFHNLLTSNLTDQEFLEKVRDNFVFFPAAGTGGKKPKSVLVTGYYQPVVEGSLQRKPPFVYPVYSIPEDLVIRRSSKGAEVGRFVGGRFLPYWSREEIDVQDRAAGNELVWLKDPLDAFFLHIEGSGLVRLRNGTLRGIHYAIKNGRPYRSIGKYMVDTGRMTLKEASMQFMRSYINSHPQEKDEILFFNSSYIFFHWTDTLGAIGNLGQEVTSGRSVAVDQSFFPPASLCLLKARQPVVQSGKIVGWKPLQRFVLAQDTGSAIQGPGRVDLFMGTGDLAGLVAGRMKERGSLYYLLLREKE